MTAALDATQLSMMNDEYCILVDDHDVCIGKASKKDCHLNTNIESPTNPLLHRAFSVLLFDKDGRLLLQRRASEKITFGDYWTNTCCSHPIMDQQPDETDTSDNHIGVRRAAVRKLEHELGLKTKVEQFKPITRIKYGARSNDKWGENEIDYILFCQLDHVELNLNKNEVSEVQFVSMDELRRMLVDDGKAKLNDGSLLQLTPWFKLLCDDALLFKWWTNLSTTLHTTAFDPKIHTFAKK